MTTTPSESRYAVLLFDFDGTLCDTKRAIFHCLAETLRFAGLEANHESDIDFVIRQGHGLHSALLHLMPEQAANLELYVDYYRRIYEAQADAMSEVFSGIPEQLELCRKAGMRLGIVSSKLQGVVERSLEAFSLGEFFELVVGVRPDLPRKPQRELFEKHLAPAFDLKDASRVLFVGDTVVDQQFARNIGADFCWAAYGFCEREDLEEDEMLILERPSSLAEFLAIGGMQHQY